MIKQVAVVLFFIFIVVNSYCQGDSKITNIPEDIKLTAEDLAVFKQQALQKVKEFEEYVKIISDKSQPNARRNLAEQEALKLFYEGATMSIRIKDASGKETVKKRPMKEYLYRLKTLPYTRVEIKYYDVIYASDFKRKDDGKYYATATVFQEFTGFTGDQLKFSTTTKQDISIIIDIINDEFYNEKHWKLFLGDINAEETKK
jgi:hypothetical protein